MFDLEFDFYVSHQQELVKKYDGKILVIIGNELVGVYDQPLVALRETEKKHEIGTFMIQPCSKGPESYTVTISSLNLAPCQ